MSDFPQTTITANGTTKINLLPGEYAFHASGSFGSGTLSLQWKIGTEDAVEYPDGSFTASGGLVIAVSGRVYLVLSGATSPSIEILFRKI